MHPVRALRFLLLLNLALPHCAPVLASERGEHRPARSPEAAREREFAQEREGGGREPHPDFPGELMRERWQMLSGGDPHASAQGFVDAKVQLQANDAVARRAGAFGALDAGLGTWEWMGPDNVGGRVRAIQFDPANANHLWVAAAVGGIATSFDGGTTWTNVDDFLPSLSVTTFARDPVTGTMWAGTGEFSESTTSTGGGFNGAGVFRSTNNGVSWTQLPATASWVEVSRLAYVSADGYLFAATVNGLFRSSDLGDTWTQVLAVGSLRDVKATATTHVLLVGSIQASFRSTDSGATWTTLTGAPSGLPALPSSPPNATARTEFAIAADQTTCYASIDRNGGEVWRSLDGGATWARRRTGDSYLGGQGWYDNAIWIDPTNNNRVVVAGIDAWRSDDGGLTFARISSWASYPGASAHADHHVIVPHPGYNGGTNRQVYFGNDGGLQRKDDITTNDVGWVNLSNGLRTAQFYKGAIDPGSGELMGGLQDNGTYRRQGSNNWVNRFGGDGGYCGYAADATTHYWEYVNLEIWKPGLFGIPGTAIGGLTDSQRGCTARFIAPFKADPVVPGKLFAGGTSLWRSTDYAGSWTAVRGPINGQPTPPPGPNCPSFAPRCSAIELVASNSSLVWVGYEDGTVSRSTDNGATWTNMGPGTPDTLPRRVVTDIAVNPSNTNEVWVTFGGFAADNVMFTNDGGATWQRRSGTGATSLPAVAVETITIHPSNRSWIYAGTALGVLASQDRGLTWGLMRSHEQSEGPAYTQVSDLLWDANRLVAFTYGRGVWRSAPIGGTSSGPALALLGTSLPGVQKGSVDWGDYDNDGDLDAIWTGDQGNSAPTGPITTTRIARNDGGGAFASVSAALPSVAEGAARWGDFDGDGDLDVVLTGLRSGGVPTAKLYRNSNGHFSEIFTSIEAVSQSDECWGDFDNDGDLDLVVAGRTGAALGSVPLTRLYLNDSGGLAVAAASFTGVSQASVDAGDYDRDGDLDLLVAGLQGPANTPVTKLYRNNGGASFTDVSGTLPPAELSAEFGDYDEDGDLDLLLMGASGLFVVRNNGGGVFATAATLPAQFEGMATWGDYDNDGDLDIAACGRDGAADVTRLYRNDAGSFVDTGARLNGVRRGAMAWGDCDNDGDVDLFQLGWASVANVAQIYRNDISATNAAPFAPSGLSVNAAGCGNGRQLVTFSWGPGSDDRTATAALGYNLRVGRTPGANDVCPSHSDTLFGARRIAARGNAGQRTSWTLSLPTGEYWWSVQTVDAAMKTSVFAGGGVARVTTSYVDAGAALTNTTGTVAWGDFDGDDDLDLLVTGVNGSDVWRNAGDGHTFTPLGAGLPAIDYSSSAWGDYDGDGDPDIVLTGCLSGSYVARIYRNNGGSFTNIGAPLVGACGGSALWTDFDADGDLDLTITGFDGQHSSARVYLNDFGNFIDLGANLAGVDLGRSAWGDYDGDGDLDLLLTGRTDLLDRRTDLYRNDGGGVLTPVYSGLPGVSFGAVAWADFDRDGLDDLVLTGSTGVGADQIARVYHSVGDGTFNDIFAGLPGIQEGSVDIGDLDNDGRLDLLLTGYNPLVGRQARVFLGTTSNNFLPAAGTGLPTVFSSDADLGDFDNDGTLDVALCGLAGPATTKVFHGCGAPANAAPSAPGGLSWSRNGSTLSLSWNASTDDHATNGAGLGYNVRIGTSPGGSQVLSAMANPANGFRRVAGRGNARARLSLSLSLPDQRYYWSVQAIDAAHRGGAFAAEQAIGIQLQPVTQGIPGLYRSAVAWGDYDDDGDQDLVICGSNGFGPLTRLYRNDGGAFVDAGAGLPDVEWGSVDWGDFDRDGDLDLAICGWNAGPLISRIYRNDGGTFTDIAAGLPGVIYGTVAWADVDNDGDLDLFLAGHDGNVGHADIYIQRNGRFGLKAQLEGVWFSYADWGDFDGDGDLDLAVMGHNGVQGTMHVYRNAWPNMPVVNTTIPGAWEGSVTWGDYDNDGDLDLLMNGWTGTYRFTEVFRNADNLLLPIGARMEGTSSSRAAWGDYDNDGDLDVAVTGFTDANVGITRVYRKDPVGYVDANFNLPGTYYSSVAWGDFDNDRDLDLALTGLGAGGVYRNDGAPPNQPPSAPGNLTSSVAGNLVTLSWTAATDDHTPQRALSYNVRLGNTPGGGEIMSAMARSDGWRKVDENGNAQLRLTIPLTLAQTSAYWSVQAIDGAFQGSPFAASSSTVVGTEPAHLPTADALGAISPNPVRGTGTIELAIARGGPVELDLYSVTGQRVARVYRGTLEAGYRQLRWEPRGDDGTRLSAGVYLMRLKTPQLERSAKVIVMR